MLISRAEARVEGLAEGRNEGLLEGRNEGRNEGLAEGRNEGRSEGLAEDVQEVNQEWLEWFKRKDATETALCEPFDEPFFVREI